MKWVAVMVLVVLLMPIWLRLFKLLFLRTVARAVIKEIGDKAISKQPDEIHLTAKTIGDAVRGQMDGLAQALNARGFVDAGEYEIGEMPGVQLRFLLNQVDNCYACVYRHPRAGVWVELITRYQSGLGATYSQQPNRGLERRKEDMIVNLPGTDPATLHQRMMAERPSEPMITLSAENIPRLFEEVYAAQIRWKKQRGSNVEEVANVIKSLEENPLQKRSS
jgi:hypothetical protein